MKIFADSSPDILKVFSVHTIKKVHIRRIEKKTGLPLFAYEQILSLLLHVIPYTDTHTPKHIRTPTELILMCWVSECILMLQQGLGATSYHPFSTFLRAPLTHTLNSMFLFLPFC